MYKIELEEDELKLIRKILSDRSRELSIEMLNIDKLGKKLSASECLDEYNNYYRSNVNHQGSECDRCNKPNSTTFKKDKNVIYTCNE